MKRTNTCGGLTDKDINKKVTLCGWCSTRRDHGGVIFIDLRDRYGLTQVVFDPSFNIESHKIAEKLGREDVVRVNGIVKNRKKGRENSMPSPKARRFSSSCSWFPALTGTSRLQDASGTRI